MSARIWKKRRNKVAVPTGRVWRSTFRLWRDAPTDRPQPTAEELKRALEKMWDRLRQQDPTTASPPRPGSTP